MLKRSATMPSSDPCQERRLEQERQKRENYLQRKVQETLSLGAPEQPSAEKMCAHGTCSLTSEELQAQSRKYRHKLRTNRILQVRAQEMLFASQRISEFRDRKTKDSKMLINHLKEVWSQDQRRRIATLEEEYAHACQSIGLSHDAALLIERNKAVKDEVQARQAEESRCWDILRFEEAMQKEREQKDLRERGDSASALRRKIVESVSGIERSFARRYNHGAKPTPQEKKVYGCSQTVNPPVTHDVAREKVYTKLAGFPIDFKDTYLHSRFDVLQDRTNRPSSAVVNCPDQEGIDAWRAAEQQRESNRCERARQIELERLYNERKLERGTAAAAKLLNDQRIALLEQEVEEAFREEERELDRLSAATNSGTCKREASAGQQRRPVYTKHKVSKPLSCPGSVITQNSEDLQERTVESQIGIQKKPKSLQDHPLIDTETQDLSKIDIQGTKIQLVDLVSYQAQQSATVQKEGERELSAQRLSNRKSVDGRLVSSSQQQRSIDGAGSILEPEIAKSLPHSSVQTKKNGISPARASCERFELNTAQTAQTEEGNVVKQPRAKSPSKCPVAKQNADGSDRTGKRQFNVSKRDADYISGPGRRWRSREKEREKEIWIKHLSDKASPCKTRYHMELVQEAAEVEREVEQYHKGIHRKRPTRSASAIAIAAHQVTYDNGETQRSQRDPSNGTRPPFISSGTIGYKKILPAPLMARSSRPACESEGNKAAAPSEDKVSLIRNVRGNSKALSNAQKGADVDIVQEQLEANAHASSLRDRHRPSSGTRARSLPDINKQCMETSRSWAHPIRPLSRPVNFQEQPKALKTVNGAKWENREDQPNDDQELGKDCAPQAVMRDSSFPRNRNKDVRSGVETWNCLADSYPGTELIFEIGKPRERNGFRKGKGSERQENYVQEPKPRQKAVWKSYINEKKQANRKNLETATGNRSIKSEPSSPPERVDRVFGSRHKRHADLQDDDQAKAKLNQPVINPNARNCHTPAARVKSLHNSRSKFIRDKSVPRFWKYPQASPKGMELEASENFGTKMKSLSSRFHSPVTKVPQEISSRRRSQKDLNFKEANGFSTGMLMRTEKSRKLEDMRSSCEAVLASNPIGNSAEEGNTNDGGPKSTSNIADTLITAWKTGKFQDDYAKAMKQAKEITSGSCSSGVFKIFSDRNYRKLGLSKSPFRRSQDREMDDASLSNCRQNERSGSANPRTNHKSPLTGNRSKPRLSSSPSRRSPDLLMGDQENRRQNLRTDSVNPKKNNRSPVARSNAAPMSSPNRTNRASQSQLGPEISKSSPVKSRAGKKETNNDPLEGQSLDFVLGSLAQQVRELDERIRSATLSSPAWSSSSSLKGEFHVKKDKQTINQPTSRLPDKILKDRGSPSTCSAALSPERCLHEINRGLPAARNISRAYTNPDRAAGMPAIGGTYMDELKKFLREISIDTPSPLRRHRVTNSPVTRNVDRDTKAHSLQGIVKKTELLCSMNKSDAVRAKAKAELEADFVSISATSSRTCSVTSRRDRRETRVVMVENGIVPVVGIDMVSGNGQLDRALAHDRFYGNGNTNEKGERERASDTIINRAFELRDVRETKTCERRKVPQENGLREDNGIRRVLEKRLVQSRWTERQAAEYRSRSVQDTLEKRTVEGRNCAPYQVLHSGQAVIREQLVKEVVENGLPSPEMHDHGSLRRNAITPVRDRSDQNDATCNVTPIRRKRESQGPQHGLSIGKPAANEYAERSFAERQRSPAAAHVAGNRHKLITKDPRRRPMPQMEDQAREYALSNGTEKLRNREPEPPLWGEGSPRCSESWRKGGMNSDATDDRMLLSGSVDFSPWNTAKLPDIRTPSNASEKRSRKPPSPVAEDVGNGNMSSKLQRFKPPPQQSIKAVGQGPIRSAALTNGDYFFHTNTQTPVRDDSLAKINPLKSRAPQNLKRPKPVPLGADAIWSINGQDTVLKRSATQNGGPPTRKRSPYEKTSPVRNKRRPASVPKSRLVKEQTSSLDEVPDSLSKSSQDDNYLPVIMAKDPESRQRVIERRRKALQLDMEHRQRLRNSRPSSARNSP